MEEVEEKSEIFFVGSFGFPDAAIYYKTIKVLLISNEPPQGFKHSLALACFDARIPRLR